ncbi:MAG TPA: SRPBCC family protein [Polyangia bacterium]|jgi:carbon monoxide dehydrogenase subunit G|nr:SRPBCC family protein [Polyangia bacterium]
MSLAIGIAATVAIAIAGLSEADLRDVTAGKVVTHSESFTTANGKSAGRGLGATIIERPIGDVWATLAHFEDRAEYVPRIKSVQILERQPDRLRVRQEIDATITTARYTAWYRLDPVAHTISWTLDPSAHDNTVAAVEGDYRMSELQPGRTLLVYRTFVDSGLKVPQSIQSFMQRRAIPDFLRAIKRRVESGGTFKK